MTDGDARSRSSWPTITPWSGQGCAWCSIALGHKPSALVLDLNMPGELTSLEAIPRVAEVSPDTRVVVLTMQEDPEFARRALRVGAAG